MMFRVLITVCVAILQCFSIRQWFTCSNFADSFRFSAFDTQLRLIEAIHSDAGFPTYLTRFNHNKVSQSIMDTVRIYASYWDVTFLVTMLSVVGIFGLVSGIWYVIRSKMHLLVKTGIFIILFSVPFIEIFFKPQIAFVFRIVLFSLPYQLVSLYGIYQFLKGSNKKLRFVAVFVLIVLSIWWLAVIPQSLSNYCK